MKQGVVIAEATGFAGGTGPLGPLIEQAMAEAALECNARGIADDTRYEQLVEIIGEAELVELFGKNHEAKIGADYIREMKTRRRHEVKERHRQELLEHERKMAEELAKQGQGED